MTTEAEHTQPSPWCPHPQWWHAADDQATEDEVTELCAAFVRALQPEAVLETGTYRGYTAAAIGDALKQNRHGRLFTIESSIGLAAEARQRVQGLPVTVICGGSLQMIPEISRGRRFGFCWLDSGPYVRGKELAAVIPYLEPGAVVGVHDTRPGRPAGRVLAGTGLNVLTLRTPRGVSFAQFRE